MKPVFCPGLIPFTHRSIPSLWIVHYSISILRFGSTAIQIFKNNFSNPVPCTHAVVLDFVVVISNANFKVA